MMRLMQVEILTLIGTSIQAEDLRSAISSITPCQMANLGMDSILNLAAPFTSRTAHVAQKIQEGLLHPYSLLQVCCSTWDSENEILDRT